LEGRERILKFGGGAHFKYVYIGRGEKVIRVKNPLPLEHFYREFL